jgi:Uma2 family endonuclease
MLASSLLIEERLEIPLEIRSFERFRRWAVSKEFPGQGRFDYLNGRIEVDMSPEDLFCHGSPKSEIAGVVQPRVKRMKLGHLFIDRARVSFPSIELSVEPDLVLVCHEAISSGRVKLVRKAGSPKGRYIELQGAVDLIVEIVSDSSLVKDTRRLPKAYYQAGVREFWLVDARGEEVLFFIYRRGKSGYRRVRPDADGFQRSEVLDCSYRFHREEDSAGFWVYELQERT